MSRKPWEIQVQYNDDRWNEPQQAEVQAARAVSSESTDDADGRDEGDVGQSPRGFADVEQLLRRTDDPDRHGNKTTDNTPLNYGRGPHDEEFGVDEDESPDQEPVHYDSQPHDDEFGVDDDDELDESKLEPADDDDDDAWDD
jgi:hypothetical protein